MGNRFRLWCGLTATVVSIVALLVAIVGIAAEQERWARLATLGPVVVATLLWILTSWVGIRDGNALAPSTRPRRLKPRQNIAAIVAAVATAAGVAVVLGPVSRGRPAAGPFGRQRRWVEASALSRGGNGAGRT